MQSIIKVGTIYLVRRKGDFSARRQKKVRAEEERSLVNDYLNGSLTVVGEALFVYLDEGKQHGKKHEMYANF